MIIGAVEKYKIKEFEIVDDNFADLSKRNLEVCNELAKHNVIFHCFLRTDHTQDEVMRRLKKAGCWAVQFGLESGSQKMLDFIKKETTIKQNITALKQSRKFGIFSDASYMIGMPEETIKEMMLTVKFIKKYKADTVGVKKFTPFPGTEIFEYCLKKKLLEKPKKLYDWSYFEIDSPEPNVSKIPTEILINTIKMLNKKDWTVYLRKVISLIRGGHYKFLLFKLKDKL